jgi:RES domain-containing protein
MTRAFRIFKSKYLDHAFDGEGSRLFGGRWNSRGRKLVYTAGTLSLAALEILAGIQDDELLDEYLWLSAEFDENLMMDILDIFELPETWNLSPPSFETRRMGDTWIAGMLSAALRVPSVTIPTEANYLINSEHPDFKKILIGQPHKFEFDSRLIRRK